MYIQIRRNLQPGANFEEIRLQFKQEIMDLIGDAKIEIQADPTYTAQEKIMQMQWLNGLMTEQVMGQIFDEAVFSQEMPIM